MSRTRSMSTRSEILQEAKARYEPGTGPWSKQGPLDQVDLVLLEEMADGYRLCSDSRGLLAGCVQRLVEETRRARGWQAPPETLPGRELPPACREIVENFAQEHGLSTDGVDALRAVAAKVVELEKTGDPDNGDEWERLELDFCEDFQDAPWNTDDFAEHLSDLVVAVASGVGKGERR